MQEIIQEDLVAKAAAEKKKKRRLRNGIKWDRLFVACAYNWYWFVLSMIVCGCLAYLYGKSQSQFYVAKSSILIRSKDSAQGTPSMTFSDLGLNTVNYIPNEPHKLRSSRIMEIVVNSLGLNVQYYGHKFLRDFNMYKQTPVLVTPLKEVTTPYRITIVPKNADEYEFRVNEGTWMKAHFGNKVNTQFGPVAITKTKLFNDKEHKDFNIIVRINNPTTVARSFARSMVVENADEHSDVLNLAIRGDNPEMCADILNALVVAYNQEGINDMNQVARNTEAFIEERVAELSKDLGSVDNEVAILTANSANSIMMGDASNTRQQIYNTEDVSLEINLASQIRHFIASMGPNDLIPVNNGMSNTGITQQINDYNLAMQDYQKIAATSSAENPVMKELSSSLASQKKTILASLDNYISTLRTKQGQAQRMQSVARSSMTANPSHEKAITEVTRQQKIKEQLYLYLLNKHEENALQMAITEPNAKVMEPALPNPTPITAPLSRIVMTGMVIGLLIPAFILYGVFWYFSLDKTIHTRREIEEACDIPILGELPAKKSHVTGEIVVNETSNDRMNEAFRIVRNNLDFVTSQDNMPSDEATVIQFTSTMSGEGKSFVAVNLALSYTYVNKRVIVVDLDLRKGKFSEYVGVQDGRGVTAYLSGKEPDLDKVIHRGALHDGFDIISVGAIPPNPTALLLSDNMRKMIEKLKKEYDFVILDTVPYNLIADAAVVNRYADLTIYVVRDGRVEQQYMYELERLNDEHKIKNLTILINDIKMSKTRYNYSYAYGYGKGYGYGYGYGGDSGGYYVDDTPKDSSVSKSFGLEGNQEI